MEKIWAFFLFLCERTSINLMTFKPLSVKTALSQLELDIKSISDPDWLRVES